MITGHTIAVQLNGFFKRSDSPLINKVKAYFEWMLTRGYSSATVEGRSNDLVDFLKWCEERGFDRAVEINKKVIEGYRRHLFAKKKANGQHMALKTQCLKLIAIKGFFKWLSQQNEILYNPAADLDLPKVGQTLPHVILSVDEVERIMVEVDLHSPLGVRDRCILEVLYATGIRRKNVGDGACHFAILVNRNQNWGQKLCHLFRHTMATQIYTQVSIKALQDVHARTHPGVRISGKPTRS